jgi:hypothetical protein
MRRISVYRFDAFHIASRVVYNCGVHRVLQPCPSVPINCLDGSPMLVALQSGRIA